jgi:hypothetical protein
MHVRFIARWMKIVDLEVEGGEPRLISQPGIDLEN